MAYKIGDRLVPKKDTAVKYLFVVYIHKATALVECRIVYKHNDVTQRAYRSGYLDECYNKSINTVLKNL